jgi:SAM-dependent methyltransferase
VQHSEKIRLLTAGHDLATAHGLEIGPRDAPLIRKPHNRVLYADYADAETIRANLHDPAIDKSQVVDVDIVTGGGKLSAATAEKFDYIVASHVAEHVPDLLGWLIDLQSVLRPGGTLGLGIPDRRFTFDRARAESTIAEAVEAWLLGLTRPSPRQVFDSAWQAFDISVPQGWRGEIPPAGELAQRQAKLRPALDLVRAMHAEQRYNDAHCWVFTPASFLTLLAQAAELGLLPYTLDTFHPTESGGYEFFAVLRRTDGETAAASIANAQALLATWPAEAEFAAAHENPEIRSLRNENVALREALGTMRASRFWRLTAPLRAAVERVRG